MKNLFFIIITSFYLINLYGQQIAAYTISNGSLNSQNLKSTIGESIIGTNSNGNYLYSVFDYYPSQGLSTQITDANLILLYPTLTNEKIFINDPYDRILITDVFGRKIMLINTYKNEIDISQLRPGYYIILIQIKSKIFIQKIIKM